MKYKLLLIKGSYFESVIGTNEPRYCFQGVYGGSASYWFFDTGYCGISISELKIVEEQLVDKEVIIKLIEQITPIDRKAKMLEHLEAAPTFNEGDTSG